MADCCDVAVGCDDFDAGGGGDVGMDEAKVCWSCG